VSYLGLDVDAAPPNTTIIKAPKSRTRVRTVRYRFGSNLQGATFQCRLDRRVFAPCASPKRLKVGVGRHRFQVRAVGPDGAADPSPAGDRFEVVGPRPKRH
jgi:hypothetical protein